MKKTRQSKLILSVAVMAAVCAASIGAQAQCYINMTANQQAIDGYGFSTAWCGQLSDAQFNTLMGTNTGQCGFSILRIRIDPNSSTNSSGVWVNNSWNDERANAAKAHARGNKVFGTPWSPPAFMKDNNNLNNGGHLLPSYYATYAQLLHDAAISIGLDYLSLQNEPDWSPDYESCVWNGTQFHDFCVTNAPAIGKPIIMPEAVNFNNSLSDPTLNDPVACSNITFVAGHFYGGGNSVHQNALDHGKHVWETEHYYDNTNGNTDFNTCMTIAKEVSDAMNNQFSAYCWWWVNSSCNLLNGSTPLSNALTIAHFTRWVRPGSTRVTSTYSPSSGVYVTAYNVSGRAVIVALNTGTGSVNQQFVLQNGLATTFEGYQSTGTTSLTDVGGFAVSSGSFTATLPARSVTTFSQTGTLSLPTTPASNPKPANGASGVAFNTSLRWTPGSNALAHAVYLGTSSSAVAQATNGSPQSQGILATTNFSPALNGSTTYYWRVDEINGTNTSVGPVWSFSTAPLPRLLHRYSFIESGGTSTADTAGGPGWAGTLPNGGSFSAGQLTLASSSSQYVLLPPGIMSPLSNFTIEVWAKLNTSASGNRLFDFGDSTSSYMFLTPYSGSTSALRFGIRTPGNNEQDINGPNALGVGVWNHVAVTLNGNLSVLYLNGAAVGTNSYVTNYPSAMGNTLNNWLGRSEFSTTYLDGVLDEFRIYSVALSAADIAADFTLGPNQVVPMSPASNPTPANGALNVALSTCLSWTPGSNALSHALYLGSDSNAVAQATPSSPQFQGILAAPSSYPPLNGSMVYYWRVDEINGPSTNTSAVWSFGTAPQPALVHRYSFSEGGGTSIADSVGGPAWNGTLPNGGTFSAGQLTLSSNLSQYVLLPANLMSTLSNCTIEVWAKLNTTTGGNRLFDFGNSTGNYMFLTPQSGSTGRLRFGILNPGNGEQDINGPNALSVGVTNHVVVTLNGNTGIVYVNSAAMGTNSYVTNYPSGMGSTTNNWLGRSEFSATAYLDGVLDEFRIYNRALSPAEITATYALGPGQLLSANCPLAGFCLSDTNLVLSWPVESAGFALQYRTNLVLGDWMNVASPVPQILGSQWRVVLPPPGATNSAFYRLVK